jgi:adenylate cyclase
MSQSRQLAAIMFTDIVGYTALMQENEQKAITIIKHYNSSLNQLVSLHHGKVLNYYGDGSLCVFSSVTEAMNCAVELQKELQTEPAVPLRIGLHVGEIFFEDEKALGDGVNIASRIQSLGQANAIFFSREIFDKLRNQPEFKSVSLGLFEFKNVSEPMEIFALANEGLIIPKREEMSGKLKDISKTKTDTPKKLIIAAGIILLFITIYFTWNFFAGKSTAKAKGNSIAILYFDNMSGDSTQEYFGEGITEEIISRLSMIEGLRVKSRASVLPYKKQNRNTKEIALELGINNLLLGSFRKQGDKFRISAQLIDATNDENIWSISYNPEETDVFEMQSDIAQQVAKKFQIKLSDANQKKLVTAPTLNIDAYDLYLKASSISFTDQGLGGIQSNTLKAVRLLKQAIQLDPGFADAYALLSLNYSYYSPVAEQPKLWFDSALIMANKAIKLNPERMMGYIAMADVKKWQGNFDETLKWLIKAHEIIPFSTAAEIAKNYLDQNDYANTYKWVMKGKEYDLTETANYLYPEGFMYFNLGLLDSMKASFQNARSIKNGFLQIDELEKLYYWFTGNEEEGVPAIKKSLTQGEKEIATRLGAFYYMQRKWAIADSFFRISSKSDDMDAGLVKLKLGEKELGKKYLETAINKRKKFLGFNDAWHYFDIARCYAALKDNRYIENFNKAIERGWFIYTWVEKDPFFDDVRDTPAFKNIWQRMQQQNEKYKAELYAAIKSYKSK